MRSGNTFRRTFGCESIPTLDTPERFPKPGATFGPLDATARPVSDFDAVQAREVSFRSIGRARGVAVRPPLPAAPPARRRGARHTTRSNTGDTPTRRAPHRLIFVLEKAGWLTGEASSSQSPISYHSGLRAGVSGGAESVSSTGIGCRAGMAPPREGETAGSDHTGHECLSDFSR